MIISNDLSSKFNQNFTTVYKELYNLHPNDPENFSLRYVNRTWFFNNHLDIVLRNIVRFQKQFYPEADIQAALFAGLFHDAGLVYKRETASPKGHESRSVEYATEVLGKLGYDENFISKVAESIKATEFDHESSLPEALLVRNADAYSHFTSVHFFAKANFTSSIQKYLKWLSDKVEGTYSKLSIPELRSEIEPLYNRYKSMISIYNSAQKEPDEFLAELLSDYESSK